MFSPSPASPVPHFTARFQAPGSAFFATSFDDVAPLQMFVIAAMLERDGVHGLEFADVDAPHESTIIATFPERGSSRCHLGARGTVEIEQVWALAGWLRWQADILLSQHMAAQMQRQQMGIVVPQGKLRRNGN